MVKWLSVLLFVFISSASFAQHDALIIDGNAPKLFINHIVTPKENFYSIGRKYNVAPKDLAAYNNLQFENGLSIGQTLKIPLDKDNFTQHGAGTAQQFLVPIYHVVQAKEGLYRVSVDYNKVPLASIKRWNHLQSDEVSVGTALIVGYLKVDKKESSLATNDSKPVSTDTNAANNDVVQVAKEAPKEEVKPIPNGDESHERLPPVKVNDDNKPGKKGDVVIDQTDGHKTTVQTVNTKSSVNFAGGYFKKLYNDQADKRSPVTESGSGGTFKSTSGWQDGKYYCFNNDAAPGSVIKITNNVTNKSVYAKVLDAIPDIKQNASLKIILSNSAAEELGAEDGKFDCDLSYIK